MTSIKSAQVCQTPPTHRALDHEFVVEGGRQHHSAQEVVDGVDRPRVHLARFSVSYEKCIPVLLSLVVL